MNKNKYLPIYNARRKLLLASAALPAIAWAGVVRAQAPAQIPRIGFLSSYSPADAATWRQAFALGLRERGWVEGKNISIEYRYAEGKGDRLSDLAADLVRLKVDLIVTSSSSDAVAAQKATQTIPVVMAAPSDPVAISLVASLARPGGNMTGLTQMAPELAGKRLELLKEMAPKLSRVAVLWNPQGASSPLSWKEIQRPAQQLGLQLLSLEVSSSSDFDKAFAAVIEVRPGALFIISNTVMITNLKRIVDFAAKSRLPSISQFAEYADAGGLMAYGPDRVDMFRRAATFVDKILKGAKPGDLPIEQATKFELVINMKTAKVLGLTIPPSILVRAGRVIE